MSDPLVERVAEAIRAAFIQQYSWSHTPTPYKDMSEIDKDQWRPQALAAIEVIRDSFNVCPPAP